MLLLWVVIFGQAGGINEVRNPIIYCNSAILILEANFEIFTTFRIEYLHKQYYRCKVIITLSIYSRFWLTKFGTVSHSTAKIRIAEGNKLQGSVSKWEVAY